MSGIREIAAAAISEQAAFESLPGWDDQYAGPLAEAVLYALRKHCAAVAALFEEDES